MNSKGARTIRYVLLLFVCFLGCATPDPAPRPATRPSAAFQDDDTTRSVDIHQKVTLEWVGDGARPWENRVTGLTRDGFTAERPFPVGGPMADNLVFHCAISADGVLRITQNTLYFPRERGDLETVTNVVMAALTGYAGYQREQEAPGAKISIVGRQEMMWAEFSLSRANFVHGELEPQYVASGEYKGAKVRRVVAEARWDELKGADFYLYFRNEEGNITSPGACELAKLRVITDNLVLCEKLKRSTTIHQIRVVSRR